jgi:hypothetical protein
MPVLKFDFKDGEISLEKYRLVDISNDTKTKMIDKQSFYKDNFKIHDNVFMVINDMFFQVSKIFDKSLEQISCMMLRDEDKYILIIPSRSYVFWNKRSVEPNEYKLNYSFGNIMKLLNS